MRIGLSFAKLLLQLSNGREVNKGSFPRTNGKLLDQFISDSILDYRSIGTQQKKIYCTDSRNLSLYLHNKFEIPSLERYIEFLEKDTIERSEAVKAVSDSKVRSFKVFEGFLTNTYDAKLTGIIRGEEIKLCPLGGSFIFINDFRTFFIPPEITIIIVENFENFKFIDRQQYLFQGISPLFVWRYQNSNDIANWLEAIPNPFIYFGDFDPKGLHIYITEFRNKISKVKGSFLIPPQLEELLINCGKKELYENQVTQLKDFNFALYPEILPVIDLIKKYKRCLEQEAFIESLNN